MLTGHLFSPDCFCACCLCCTQVPWKEYVPLAWQVDPCLALGLLDHYPATGQLRTALEAMVVKHATDPQVRLL